MKILFVTPYVPAHKATHASSPQMMELISYLAPEHEVHVATFVSEAEEKHLDALKSTVASVSTVRFERVADIQDAPVRMKLSLLYDRAFKLCFSRLKGIPYIVAKYYSKEMKNLIHRLTDRSDFDVVQTDFSFMGQYLSYVKAGRKVLFEHDVSIKVFKRFYEGASSLPGRFFARREYRAWVKFETRTAALADAVITVGEEDRDLLRSYLPSLNVTSVSPSVNVPDITGEPARENTLVFMGAMNRERTNVDAVRWFLDDIFPRILAKKKDVTFFVVGADAPESLTSRASDRIKFTGFIDDVDAFLGSCTIFVAPIRYGGGVKVKVLHAMACCLPVVATSIGTEGMKVEDRRELIIEDSPHTFASSVLELLDDSELRNRIGSAGQDYVAKYHGSRTRCRTILDVYKRIL